MMQKNLLTKNYEESDLTFLQSGCFLFKYDVSLRSFEKKVFMKKVILSMVITFAVGSAWAQQMIVDSVQVDSKPVVNNQQSPSSIELNTKAVKFVPYGFIRNDFYFDSRENFETASGLFYIIPKDRELNAFGEDINEITSSRFLSIATRLGLKVYAQKPILGAELMAQVETDFAGFSTNTTMFRIRQAYMKMSWKKWDLTLGQTWHPMFGEVVPEIQSLATGSPFQPFNRSPQLRLDWKLSKTVRVYLAGLYQLQYTSWGPEGGSTAYQNHGKVPELYFGLDWKKNGWIVGAGADLLHIHPREVVEVKVNADSSYRHTVDEKLTSLSLTAFMKYTTPNKKFSIRAKTVYGENMSHLLLLSGYGVSKVLPDGSFEYTNIRNSTSWMNFVYGDKWQVGFFAGFMKNLGSDDKLYSPETTYIFGYNNLDKVFRLSPMLCYNLKRWTFGVEYEMTSAFYGDLKLETGKVENTHQVTNHRAVAVMMFNF